MFEGMQQTPPNSPPRTPTQTGLQQNCGSPVRGEKSVVKDKAPYFILKYLKDKEATSEERAVAKALIEESYSEKKVTRRTFNDALRDLVKDELIVKISEGKINKYYITKSGIGALERCGTKKASSPSPFKSKGKNALILSLYYLGATTKENAVMRPDAINEGKLYTDTFHPYDFNGGNFDQGIFSMRGLFEKKIVKKCSHKRIDSDLYYLTEEGNKIANGLIRGVIPQPWKSDISYELYKESPLFEDIKKEIIYALFENEAFSKETGVIYPFIISAVNNEIEHIRFMDDKKITPEYAALFDLVKNGFVKKEFNKGDTLKFFLTAKGVRAIVSPNESMEQESTRKITEMNDPLSMKEEKEEIDATTNFKRARDVDAAASGSPEPKRVKTSPDVPSTPLRNPRQPESSQMKEDIERMDGSPRKEKVQLTSYPSRVSLSGGNGCVALNEEVQFSKRTRELPTGRSYSQMREIDLKVAKECPPLKVDQVFSTVHPFGYTVIPPKITEVKLIVDTREPGDLRKLIQEEFGKKGLKCEEKKLNAGDYTWVAIGADGKEYLLNAIVERKAISDFDASYKYKSRYYDQLNKMRASEISNLLYLIEGRARRSSFHDSDFDLVQQFIENVREENILRIIRTLEQEETIDFLVDITKSLNEIAKGGRLPGEWFAYPLCDVKDMNKRIQEFIRPYLTNRFNQPINHIEIPYFDPEWAQELQE